MTAVMVATEVADHVKDEIDSIKVDETDTTPRAEPQAWTREGFTD